MVKERKLAVPYTTVFITQLPKETQQIIREDLMEYAREHNERLDWDTEARDYVGMTRRFCDIEEIYRDTNLIFCEPGEDKRDYELSLQRTITIRLPDDDIEALCRKAGGADLTVGELIENFISDLVGGSRTNGSDERMLAHQWFERCWFGIGQEITFLTYLIDYGLVDEAMDFWTDLEGYKKQDNLYEDDKEDMEYCKEELTKLFNEYKEEFPESQESSLETAMGKVEKWSREREELLEGERKRSSSKKEDNLGDDKLYKQNRR